MKNKGFVLMETIVVIVVVSVALLTIFSSYNKILSKVKTENKYDTSEYIYMTKYIRSFFKTAMKDSNVSGYFGCNITDNIDTCVQSISSSDVKNYFQIPNGSVPIFIRLKSMKELYNVEKIYILTDFDNFELGKNQFDAYMIDYIRKLDVKNADKLIIVEYQKEAKKDGTNEPLTEYNTSNNLYETYIASLEW